MFSRLAAPLAVLCTVLAGSAIAAERRPVAVIDLSNEDPGRAKAVELGEALNNHADLKPVDDPSMIAELYARISDADAVELAEARARHTEAEAAFARREFARAATTAQAGQTKLGFLNPTPEVVRLYAELTFVLAQARLAERKPAEAAALFRLVPQLNPEFRPNPARVYPEVIDAYEAARKVTPPTGTISVSGTGTAYLDGKPIGASPQWFAAPAGLHVVWLVGPDRDPRALVVTVEANRKVEAKVDDAPTSKGSKVRRARLALKIAPDPAARAAAMQQLAALLEVKDAVLLSVANGKLIIQHWGERIPGFSALREIKGPEKPIELLAPLAPPKLVVKPKKEEKGVVIVPVEKPWYEKRRYWGLGGGIALSIIVGSILAIQSWDRFIGTDPDMGFKGKDPLARPR